MIANVHDIEGALNLLDFLFFMIDILNSFNKLMTISDKLLLR